MNDNGVTLGDVCIKLWQECVSSSIVLILPPTLYAHLGTYLFRAQILAE